MRRPSPKRSSGRSSWAWRPRLLANCCCSELLELYRAVCGRCHICNLLAGLYLLASICFDAIVPKHFLCKVPFPRVSEPQAPDAGSLGFQGRPGRWTGSNSESLANSFAIPAICTMEDSNAISIRFSSIGSLLCLDRSHKCYSINGPGGRSPRRSSEEPC
jgi:hypothetical protein